jgi:hypothetical protein
MTSPGAVWQRRLHGPGRVAGGPGGKADDGTGGVSELDYGTRVDKRSYYSEYRPTPEIFWVSPGYDEGDLPELPLCKRPDCLA